MKAITKHLIPNAGTWVIVGLLFLAQGAGAIPSVAPAQPLAPSQTLISYQGTLTDPDGNPIDGTVTMEFALYDAVTDGNLLWGPETQSVEVRDGLFHVLLGSQTPIAPPALTSGAYLQMEINDEALQPRELMTSVAYALQAAHLVTVNTPDVGLDSGGIEINDAHGHTLRIDGNEIDSTYSMHLQREHPDNNVHIYADVDMHGKTVSNCGALTEANLQTEEELGAERIDRFKEGDVLCWGDGQLEKCAQAGDPLVQAVADAGGRPIVIGAELVKVIGPVKRGDFLVASDVPGYAMAADDPAFGTVIAQSLEDLEGEQGLIKAMIRKF